MFYFDPLYLLLSLPALLIAGGAQLLIRYYYSRYSKIGNSANMNGIGFVEQVARRQNMDVQIAISLSELSDNYNPSDRVLTLSDRVAHAPSIASVGITAHELGHAMQHKSGFFLFNIRSFMVPIVNMGTWLAFILFMIGLSFQIFGLVILGIVFFSFSTVFTLVTLPIELDASRRAIRLVEGLQVFTGEEVSGIKKVLFAAALTYVAAVLQSLSTLLYYILRAFGGRQRN